MTVSSQALSYLSSVAGIGIFPPAGIVSILSLSGAYILASHDKNKDQMFKSPWGYLLSLEKIK
jgi:hypothetical protein